ncbi:hypothetical protein F4561_004100 [Lipingzhangella halophila]|uniref:Uncharacterized protein n=1 Tax=Lipingzhangella halophila TaxID=1783352 RepID=A0A7W7RJV1_9ACTN|nr:hypothetical protein [Lipingzhangella halophila]MBB4933280.1 hypothetical protein [Lipingzhangella halophila]
MLSDPRPLGPEEQNDLLLQITLLLSHSLPEGWQEVAVSYRALGSHSEMLGQIQRMGQRPSSHEPPPDLAKRFQRLRAGMYRPGVGTWFTATYRLTSSSGYSVAYDQDNEPAWVSAPPESARDEELRMFPRDAQHIPEWWGRPPGGGAPDEAARAPAGRGAGAPTGPPSTPASAPAHGQAHRPTGATVSIAKPYDGTQPDGTPIFQRPPVPPEARDAVVRYLADAPIILSARSFSEDLLAPGRPANVPLTYHTDGTWIWPGSVGYYLRAHGAPPQPELVAHIRDNGFRLPALPENVETAALENLYRYFQSGDES